MLDKLNKLNKSVRRTGWLTMISTFVMFGSLFLYAFFAGLVSDTLMSVLMIVGLSFFPLFMALISLYNKRKEVEKIWNKKLSTFIDIVVKSNTHDNSSIIRYKFQSLDDIHFQCCDKVFAQITGQTWMNNALAWCQQKLHDATMDLKNYKNLLLPRSLSDDKFLDTCKELSRLRGIIEEKQNMLTSMSEVVKDLGYHISIQDDYLYLDIKNNWGHM